MYKLTPIDRTQITMIKRYLAATSQQPHDHFDVRDLCVVYRTRGRLLVPTLPGLRQPAKYLDRRTDEDEGPYA